MHAPALFAILKWSTEGLGAVRENGRTAFTYLSNRILHDQNVRHRSEHAEVLSQFVVGSLPAQSSDEELTRGGIATVVRCTSTGRAGVAAVHRHQVVVYVVLQDPISVDPRTETQNDLN